MKIEIVKAPKFQPIGINMVFQTENEVKAFYAMINCETEKVAEKTKNTLAKGVLETDIDNVKGSIFKHLYDILDKD